MSQKTQKPILVVEDDSAIRELIQMALNLEGYPVETATNGKEAWEALQNHSKPPSLLIVDLMMPVMDGKEFLKLKNESPQLQSIPTIVMSAAVEKKFPDETHRQVNIRKPLDLDEFLKTVQNLISLSPEV